MILSELIYTIKHRIYEPHDDTETSEFNETFIKSIKDRETQKSYEIKNLDELFE